MRSRDLPDGEDGKRFGEGRVLAEGSKRWTRYWPAPSAPSGQRP